MIFSSLIYEGIADTSSQFSQLITNWDQNYITDIILGSSETICPDGYEDLF
jgi:hypothetical protein